MVSSKRIDIYTLSGIGPRRVLLVITRRLLRGRRAAARALLFSELGFRRFSEGVDGIDQSQCGDAKVLTLARSNARCATLCNAGQYGERLCCGVTGIVVAPHMKAQAKTACCGRNAPVLTDGASLKRHKARAQLTHAPAPSAAVPLSLTRVLRMPQRHMRLAKTDALPTSYIQTRSQTRARAYSAAAASAKRGDSP